MDLKTFRHIVRRIHKWEGTPDFRNKLIYNTKAVFSLYPYTKSSEEYNELIHRYKVMIDYLDTVRPKSMAELAKYMRSNDLKNVDLYKP
jgi:hypothetical protein